VKIIRYRTKIPIYSERRFKTWVGKCNTILKRQSIPDNHINKVFKLKVEYHIHREKFVTNTGQFLDRIQRMLGEVGIVRSGTHWCMSRCEIITKVEPGEPSMSITLWVDENDSRNEEVDFNQLPVIGEMESSSFTPVNLNPITRRLFS